MSEELALASEDLASEITNAHPPLASPQAEAHRGIVTDELYDRLPPDLNARLLAILNEHGRNDLVSRLASLRSIEREYRRAVLTYAASFLPAETKIFAGISAENPPPDVHSMVREEFFAGDFYNCDMIVQTLSATNINIQDHGRYLDFGASSGRVVRNMHASFPAARWYACDPQTKSVEWARAHLQPAIHFFASPLSPPLPHVEDAYFDGVYAISVWSHFSERAAIAWFSEMRRCLKPGGWLLFTTHGVNTLRYYAQYKLKPDDQIRTIHAALLRDGYAFEDVFGSAGDWTIPAVNWGMCYLLPSWIALNVLGKGWSFNLFEVGRCAMDQDTYLLVRTAM